jgi:Tfp pilus assembly protein PilN
MSMPPLNLASRPFRNERLPALLLALGFTAAGAITIKQAIAVRALMPGRTSSLARQVAELENERERLRQEQSQLRAPRPEASVLAQWTLVKDLVDSRTFSWSGLFSFLEETLPKGVRLVSIAPKFEEGERTVQIVGVARTHEDLLEFIKVLEDRPEFDDVLPQNRDVNEQNLIDFRLTMAYRPPSSPAVKAAANVSSTASPSPLSSPAASPSPSPSASPTASPSAAAPAVPSPPVAARPSPLKLSGRARERVE